MNMCNRYLEDVTNPHYHLSTDMLLRYTVYRPPTYGSQEEEISAFDHHLYVNLAFIMYVHSPPQVHTNL
jgi:hypothetical protein